MAGARRSAREVRPAWLTALIREVDAASYGNYGATRVHAELVLGRGLRAGHNAVAMLMQRAGIAGRSGARKRTGSRGVVFSVKDDTSSLVLGLSLCCLAVNAWGPRAAATCAA